MSLALSKAELSGDFATAVDKLSQSRIASCVQCRKCSAGCPLSDETDLMAHELVRLVQLGQVSEVLSSRMIWRCTSCQTCASRCPQQVNICALNDTLRRMSRESSQVNENTTLPTFNDSFLASVRKRGRVYEVGLMAAYKLKTLRLFEDMDKLPLMLAKGKLRLLPKSVAGAGERNRIWKRVQARKGRQP
jgi:heterodisulfide reductase subunit C2